jgi:ABC-2 type transport system permease protein
MKRISWNRVWGLIKKEYYQILRDPSSILIAFVLPAMLIFIFGYAVSLDIRELRIGLVLEDTNPEVNLFAESFLNSSYFAVTKSHSRDYIEDQLLEGKLRGMVVVPFNFDRDISTKKTFSPIQVIADGSETNTANLLQNYVRGAWQIWLQQKQIQEGVNFSPPIQPQQRTWFNSAGISRYSLLPGAISIIMTIIGTLLTALVIAREWERGTMEAVMATPVTIGEIVLGKLIPYFILAQLSMMICFFLSVVVFEVPFRGSFLLLFLLTSLFLGAALSLGLLISTTARNQFEASQMSLYTAYLPAFLLSGFLFEISSMPLFIQIITYFLPARYFVSNLQTIFLAGDIYPLILKNCLGIFIIGGFFAMLVVKRIRKRID